MDYDDEDEGGSSQDAYESDFINDNKEEEAAVNVEEEDEEAKFESDGKKSG